MTRPTLYALIIRLLARRAGQVRATAGQLAHAAFLDVLRQVDPALAQAVHDSHGRRPFTLSPLHGFAQRGPALLVRAGQEGWLRVTLLDPVLFRTFIDYFLRGSGGAIIRLGEIDFQVTEILSNGASHPLAGAASIEALRRHWAELPSDAVSPRIELTFASPTAFRSYDEQRRYRSWLLLPLPERVFGELARYWDELSGEETRAEVAALAGSAVVVTRYRLQTRVQHYRRPQVGFTGNVTFELLEPHDLSQRRRLNRLADLAFFTGLGTKKTMGMGQVYRCLRGDG